MEVKLHGIRYLPGYIMVRDDNDKIIGINENMAQLVRMRHRDDAIGLDVREMYRDRFSYSDKQVEDCIKLDHKSQIGHATFFLLVEKGQDSNKLRFFIAQREKFFLRTKYVYFLMG